MQTNSTSTISQLVIFLIKAVVVFTLFIVGVVILVPDYRAISYSVKKEAKNEKTRIALMSFIQNPAALYSASEIDEKAGKFKDAILEMQLAIGLLEMHNANPIVIKRYKSRLDNLNTQIKTAIENTPNSKPVEGTFNGLPVKRWQE